MIAIRRHLFKLKRLGLLLVHFSFIVILTGALITHIFGKDGTLHLRENEISNTVIIQTNDGRSALTLPFKVELVKFILSRYPGSMSPSSYESELLIHIDGTTRRERVYMNNVLDIKGYRFYQASFDSDEKGTVLSVNKDIAGRYVTYTGYSLLLVGCLVCLFGKNSRLRTLYMKLNKGISKDSVIANKVKQSMILIPLFFAISSTVSADEMPKFMADAVQKIAIPKEHAEVFGALPIQSVKGRIIPINTFSSEILRKLHKDIHIGSLNSDQFLLSLLAVPEMWMHVPLITNSNNAIADYFNFPLKKISYVDLFQENGTYKLQGKLYEAYNKPPAERTEFNKDIIKLDEKANILHQLFDYRLIRLFPKIDDPDKKWYAPGDDLSAFTGKDSMFVSSIFFSYLSEIREAMKSDDWSNANELLDLISIYQTENNNISEFNKDKIALELKYNKLDIFRLCKIGYLSLGGLLLLFSFALLVRKKNRLKWIIIVLSISVFFVFLFQILGMGMRWKIGGFAPWSNSYETMVFLSWATVLAGLLFARRSTVTFSLATLFAGIILFVSGLNWLDPQINPLVPVLKSPWLMFHVAILMTAYGFFGIGFLIGLVNLIMMAIFRKEKFDVYSGSLRELSIINEIVLIIGLILMIIGTFMGAVWANESWGRYWGWDPKETWALITVIVYAIVTHLHLLKKGNNMLLINICSVIAFASVLMTYFGVNYFLSGMHSYGQ